MNLVKYNKNAPEYDMFGNSTPTTKGNKGKKLKGL